jgi:hypothetical protein
LGDFHLKTNSSGGSCPRKRATSLSEAELLKAGDCKARAYFLFQASIEECGLIDLLSNWATNVMRGEQFDEDRLSTVLRGRSERITVNHANSASLFVAIGPDGISTPKATVTPAMLTGIAGRNDKLLSNMADKLELALQWQKNVPLSGLVQSAVH